MKKQILKFGLVLFCVSSLSSCLFNLDDLPNPSSQNLCQKKEEKVKNVLYGHTWELRYYNATTGDTIFIPNVMSGSAPNKIVWAQDGSGVEYNYLGQQFNSGTFYVTDCGETLTINTLFLYPDVKLTFVKITPVYWEGTLPAGSGGAPFDVRVKANKIN